MLVCTNNSKKYNWIIFTKIQYNILTTKSNKMYLPINKIPKITSKGNRQIHIRDILNLRITYCILSNM